MVEILDSTLREGEQTSGVKFTKQQKVEIAKALDDFGVDFIEAGHPFVSEYDFKCVKAVSDLSLNAKVLGHARAKKEDIDAVLDAGCEWVGIFCGVNELSRKYKLNGRKRDEVLDIIQESIEYAKGKGLSVRYTVEDATRTPWEDLAYTATVASGADRFSIADTVGVMTPEKMHDLISFLKGHTDLELEVHCHNDYGLAVANSLAAYRAGVSVVDVSVNGLGERAGLTSLAEFCIALQKLYGENSRNYGSLTHLTSLVEKHSGVLIDRLRPIVGKNAFTHMAKLHRDAVQQNPECYESIDPNFIGRQ